MRRNRTIYKYFTFYNKKTNEYFDKFVDDQEKQQLLEENPDLTVALPKVNIISGTGLKPPEGFRDVLRTAKKNNPGSNIDTF